VAELAAPSLWEVLDRACNTGPMMAVREFDMKIFGVASRLVREYGIEYDPGTPVPSDDGLADDVWRAGLELFCEVGAYCVNSGRVIGFDESEVRAGLGALRGEAVIGDGSERRVVGLRDVDDNRPPSIVMGGVVESDFPEGERFVKLYQSIAQEPVIDGFYVGPPLQSSEGRQVRSGTPLETHLGRSMAGWAREAIRRAGRPGMHFASACTTAIANVVACDPIEGVRRTDAIVSTIMPELKTNYENLNKVVFCHDYGCIMRVYNGSMIGGWAGGPEGALIVSIANATFCPMLSGRRMSPVNTCHPTLNKVG